MDSVFAASSDRLIHRWFMPINIAITFVVGGTFGWLAVKMLNPEPYLQDLIIAMCSAGFSLNLAAY